MHDAVSRLISPERLVGRNDVLARPPVIPATNGIYAWYFREVPDQVPMNKCARLDELALLYVGISPSRTKSKSNLRKRIRQHYASDAYGSTLRRTLGVLLSKKSGFQIRRIGNGKRKTLTHLGEQWLDRWMEQNAFVTWVEHPEPWLIEEQIIKRLSVPLNIQGNQQHPFCRELKHLRSEASERARELPIVNQRGQTRHG